MSRFFALKQGFQFYRYPVRGQCQGFFNPVMQRSPPPGRGKRVPIHILSAIAFRSFRVLFHWITLLPQSLRIDETSRASSTQRLVPFPEDFLRSGNTWSTGRTVDLTGSVTCFSGLFTPYLLHIHYTYFILQRYHTEPDNYNIQRTFAFSFYPSLTVWYSACLYVSPEWENSKEI